MQNDDTCFATPTAPAETGAALPVRRKGGELEALVGEAINDWITGAFDADKLTPARIGTAIKLKRGLDKAPSTGAINNVLEKWEAIGYITLGEGKPVRFDDYTEGARTEGLTALRNRHKATKQSGIAPSAVASPGNAQPDSEPELQFGPDQAFA